MSNHPLWPAITSNTGRFLLTRVLWMSFAITLFMFAYIIASDYEHGVDEIHKGLVQIENSYQPSLSRSLWNFDSEQVITQLDGILNFPGIQYVLVESRDLGNLQAGERPPEPELKHQFSLTYVGENQLTSLGRVTILGTYDHLYQELESKALRILAVQAVKTFTISMLLLLLIHQTITRHLQTLSEWATNFSLHKLDQTPDLGVNDSLPSELENLVSAIGIMHNTLQEDIREREQAEQQIRDTRSHLSLAIENTALGFCRYNTGTNRLEANNHFCNQLRTSKEVLEHMPSPLVNLIDRIEGNMAAEQKERINQLLQGRIQRVQGEFVIRKFNGQDGYFDITLQTIRYQDNRPEEILICSVDKTREHQSMIKVDELIQMNEHNLHRAQQSHQQQLHLLQSAYERLKRDFERCKLNRDVDEYIHFLKLLGERIGTDLLCPQDTDSKRSLHATREMLQLLIDTGKQDFDLVTEIRQWHRRYLADNTAVPLELVIPYSLILQCRPDAFSWLLGTLMSNANNRHDDSMKPVLEVKLKGHVLELTLHRIVSSEVPVVDTHHREYLTLLCHHFVNLKMHGNLDYFEDRNTRMGSYRVTISLDYLL